MSLKRWDLLPDKSAGIWSIFTLKSDKKHPALNIMQGGTQTIQ